MSRVNVMIGLPGSGKTTWARKKMEELSDRSRSIYISGDDIRTMYGCGNYVWDEKSEPATQSAIIDLAARMYDYFDNIFLDEALVSNTRQKRAKLAIKFDCVTFVYVKTSKRVCVERRGREPKSENQDVDFWEKVIDHHANLLEVPTEEEIRRIHYKKEIGNSRIVMVSGEQK